MANKPFVPIPPQVAETEDLRDKLQELLSYLKSTEPESPETAKVAKMLLKIETKLKQVQQRAKIFGSPEPDLRPHRAPAPAPPDTRNPAAIQVLTTEFSAQAKEPHLRQGPELQVLQQVLQFSGCAVAPSGQFDAATASALKAFQTRHKLPTSPRVDDKTRAILNRQLQYMRAAERAEKASLGVIQAWLEQSEQTIEEAVSHKLQRLLAEIIGLFLDPICAAATQAPPSPEEPPQLPSLSQHMSTPGPAHIVSKGPEVEILQQALHQQGYDIKVTGAFDLHTFSVLKTYQSAHGLPASGETDAATRASLNQMLHNTYLRTRLRYDLWNSLLAFGQHIGKTLTHEGHTIVSRLCDHCLYLLDHPEAAHWLGTDPGQTLIHELGPPGPGTRLSHGREVLLLQELLQALGFQLPLSEIYDADTGKAVRTFQGQHKLPLSGIVDGPTRQALNHELERVRRGPAA